jgi:cytoskeletal protein CcmA (bactofilin family)
MALWNPKHEQQAPAPSAAGPTPGRYPDPPPYEPPPAPPPPRREEPAQTPVSSSDLLLGPNAEFDGTLTFRGTLRIDAKFKGSILTDDMLVVGEHAQMNAEITCGSIVVQGEVTGNVHAAASVELRHTAKVRGDVTAPSLVVEKGALLHGAVRQPPAEKPPERQKKAGS